MFNFYIYVQFYIYIHFLHIILNNELKKIYGNSIYI